MTTCTCKIKQRLTYAVPKDLDDVDPFTSRQVYVSDYIEFCPMHKALEERKPDNV